MVLLNPYYWELMVPTDAPTHTQCNFILVHSAYVTLTLLELPHSPGFMSTQKHYLYWCFLLINFHFCTLYSITVKLRYRRSYIFEENDDFPGHTSHAELNFND